MKKATQIKKKKKIPDVFWAQSKSEVGYAMGQG